MMLTARQFYRDPHSKFAVYVTAGLYVGWVVDTGVGGTFSWNSDKAKWWDSEDAADTELIACELLKLTGPSPIRSYLVVRVR